MAEKEKGSFGTGPGGVLGGLLLLFGLPVLVAVVVLVAYTALMR